jgi:hypothetical protein
MCSRDVFYQHKLSLSFRYWSLACSTPWKAPAATFESAMLGRQLCSNGVVKSLSHRERWMARISRQCRVLSDLLRKQF